MKSITMSSTSALSLLGVGAISAAVPLPDGRMRVHAFDEVAAAIERLDPDVDRAVALLVAPEPAKPLDQMSYEEKGQLAAEAYSREVAKKKAMEAQQSEEPNPPKTVNVDKKPVKPLEQMSRRELTLRAMEISSRELAKKRAMAEKAKLPAKDVH